MITYQEIYDILRKEKYNEALQPLQKNFLKEAGEYLEDKKKTLEKEDKSNGLFSDTIRMTRKQMDNSIAIIRELITIREKKILTLALTASITGIGKRDAENLLGHEEALFNTVVNQLEQCQKEIARKLEGEEEEKEQKNMLIRFKENVPAFFDENGSELGPFKQDEIANLSKQIASILISDAKATMVEEN